MTAERLAQLDAARERADTERAPPRTDQDYTLAAARHWLAAVSNDGSDLWAAFAAKALLRGLDGEHVNPEAVAWLGKQCVRGDAVHRKWSQAIYRYLEERDAQKPAAG